MLIDFDNVVGVDHLGARFAKEIQHWLAWIEDGRFDPFGRRRVLLERRVYWNDQNAKWRPDFEALGFATFECRSEVRGKKSAADMMIALDAQQLSYENPAIEEYILLTTDTDFVPLLNKLEDRDKQTVAAANPENLSFRVYSNHADMVISTRDLRAAMGYVRPRPWMQRQVDAVTGFWRGITGGLREIWKAIDRRFGAFMRWLKPNGPLLPWGRPLLKLTDAREKELDRGAEILADIGKLTPGLPMSRKTIIRILSRDMPEFSTSGRNPHLGCGSYVKMLERMADLRPDLKLHRYRNGGTALSWRFPTESV